MRAMACLYCFFCSSEPVRVSIHFAAISVLSFVVRILDLVVELCDAFCEEAPGPPELFEVLATDRVERVDLARRPLLGRHLGDVDETALLDPDQQRVDGALDDVREPFFTQPCRDLVAVGRADGEDREDDALERAL